MQPLLLLAAGLLASEISVDVPLYLGASLPPPVLQKALAEVDRLFEDGGVRFRWQVSPQETSPSTPVTVIMLKKPARPVVTGCRRNLHDHRLGHTHLPARRVTLWTEQVARAVHGDWDAAETPYVDEGQLATALGRVLAHELGHLFLSLNGHRDEGLMRASFSHRSLTGKRDGPFRLSKKDMERVRALLARNRRDPDL